MTVLFSCLEGNKYVTQTQDLALVGSSGGMLKEIIIEWPST